MSLLPQRRHLRPFGLLAGQDDFPDCPRAGFSAPGTTAALARDHVNIAIVVVTAACKHQGRIEQLLKNPSLIRRKVKTPNLAAAVIAGQERSVERRNSATVDSE